MPHPRSVGGTANRQPASPRAGDGIRPPDFGALTENLTSCTIRRLRGGLAMAGKGHRVQIKMKSSESPHIYYLKKNKQNTPDRLELKKYDPVVRKHVTYKEAR
jgi:large subunit ribosomal protein L33